MANPFPFTAGQVLTAAQMNGIGEAWTSYTPVIKGGTTTVTATITYARYARVNKLVFVQVLASITSTGAVNGAISIGLPSGLLPGVENVRLIRGSFLLDDGTGIYTGGACITSAYGSHTAVVGFGGGPVVDAFGANNPAITLGSGDFVGCEVVYEVA
jgi:hypothetical protein